MCITELGVVLLLMSVGFKPLDGECVAADVGFADPEAACTSIFNCLPKVGADWPMTEPALAALIGMILAGESFRICGIVDEVVSKSLLLKSYAEDFGLILLLEDVAVADDSDEVVVVVDKSLLVVDDVATVVDGLLEAELAAAIELEVLMLRSFLEEERWLLPL